MNCWATIPTLDSGSSGPADLVLEDFASIELLCACTGDTIMGDNRKSWLGWIDAVRQAINALS